MTLEQLYYLTEIKKQGSLSKAADSFFISQAALSMSIKNLEKEFNIPLFKRTHKGMIPTDDGLFIIGKAEKILHEISEINQFVADKTNNYTGKISIAISPLFSLSIFPSILQKISQVLPNIELECIDLSSTATNSGLSYLLQATADFVITAIPYNKTNINSFSAFADSNHIKIHPLATYQLAAYMRTKHPLAGKDSLSAEDIKLYTVLATKSFAEYIPKVLKDKFILTHNFESIERLIISDNYILLAPELFSHQNPYIYSKQISSVPLTDDIKGSPTLFVLAYNKSVLTTVHKKIINIILENSHPELS